MKNIYANKKLSRGDFYQLKLPLNVECMIPNDDSVRLLANLYQNCTRPILE